MEFQNIMDRAVQVRRLYEEKEKELYGSPRTSEEIALGFAGDVANLVKLIDAENGKRRILHSKAMLEHQFANCLWSIIVLANIHGVDLEKSFFIEMDRLETHLLENPPES
jgi:NTP pyrophosphatase (non-canonical NTP hydrolase)